MEQELRSFVDNLVGSSSEIAALYREHMTDQGELLPHVFMGDITRLVVANASPKGCPDWIVRLLQQLKSVLMSECGEVAGLVGVSFVENLCGETRAIEALRPKMGVALRNELREICGV